MDKISNLQIAIIYSSCIGSLVNEWNPNESTRAINDLKIQIKKFMFKRSRTNKKEFLIAIKIGNMAWKKSIDHFAKESLKIDAYSIVIALWGKQSEILTKFTTLSEKRIEKFWLSSPQDHTLESEMNAYKVADYLDKQIKEENTNFDTTEPIKKEDFL